MALAQTDINKKEYIIERDGQKVTFSNDEVDSYNALKRMLEKDCQSKNSFTMELNPSMVKACRALRDILKDAQEVALDNDYDYQVLNMIINHPVNK